MSKSGELTKTDLKKQLKAAIVWSAPVLLMYLSAVLGTIQEQGHIISWSDFVPSTMTIGAGVAWVLSQIQGIILRWLSEKK